MSGIQVEGLTLAYGKIQVVKNVSFDIVPGEVTALIGPNGAGKTSLIRGISGVLKPLAGHVKVGGELLGGLTEIERARILAVVPQAREYGGAVTVRQAVSLGRTPHMSWLGQMSEKDHRRVDGAMQQTSLLDLADRRLAEISGGERQRVFLARALAQNTPILLMDEPTNNLDLHHQMKLLSLIRGLVTENGYTVLIAIHDLNMAAQFADRILLMSQGELVAEGSPEEVLTAGILSEIYQTDIDVIPHPVTKTRLVVLRGLGPADKNYSVD